MVGQRTGRPLGRLLGSRVRGGLQYGRVAGDHGSGAGGGAGLTRRPAAGARGRTGPDVHPVRRRARAADEILRARFWKSFEKPQAIMPNRINEYLIDLHTNDHRFLKGHRIMVQVQSTWFPVYDRNPQKFVVNIFRAKDSDYQVATQRIFRSKAFPSHITLPVRRT